MQAIRTHASLAFLSLLFYASPSWSVTLTPASPAATVGQSVTINSDVPVTWTFSGAGHIVTNPDGSVTYTAPASIAAQHVMAGCEVMPNDTIFNTPINNLPLSPNNSLWTNVSNGGGYGTLVFQESWGISVADNSASTIDIKTYYDSVDHGPFVWLTTPQLNREGGAYRSRENDTDHHIMTLRKTDCSFWETYNDEFGQTYTCRDGTSGCTAQSAVQYNWSSYPQLGGTDAANLPLAPLTLHLDEIEAGAIRHALRYTDHIISNAAPIWPAFNYGPNPPGTCSSTGCMQAPVYGARFRLKSGYNISSFNWAAQVILNGLKQYGMILADNGSYKAITTASDVSEDPDVAAGMNQIQAANITIDQFEAVDESSLMVNWNSYQVNPSNSYVSPLNSAVLTATPTDGSAAVSVPIAIQAVGVGLPLPAFNIVAGTSYTLSSWVNGSSNQGVNWTLVSGVGSVTGNVYTAPATQADGTTSKALLKAVATADANAVAFLKITILPNGSNPTGSIRIDVGSPTSTTDLNGSLWLPDIGIDGGRWNENYDYPNWTPDGNADLYQYQTYGYSYGNDETYHFIVPNGDYNIRLMFAHIRGCYPASNCAPTFNPIGTAPLNLEENGIVAKANFDWGAAINYAYTTPSDANYTAHVTHNALDVAIRGILPPAAASAPNEPSYAASPNLNGIEITPISGTSSSPPSISVTSPASGATFTAPASISLAASATANTTGGSITQVSFYEGSTLLQTVTSSPYAYTWTNVPAGTYSLTAQATDNTGAMTTSAPVSVTVQSALLPPTVNITSPSSGASFTAPASISIAASAAAGSINGQITQVSFYQGSTLLQTVTSSPYTYTWTNVPAGTYSLTAVAVDNTGSSSTSSPVSITVNAAVSNSPTITITSPLDNATFIAPATIPIQASVVDNGEDITSVSFYEGSSLLGVVAMSPYTFPWTPVAAGTYGLKAKALDSDGNFTTSPSVTVVVSSSTSQSPVGVTVSGTGVRVYPNPWRSDKNANADIVFDQLLPGGDVKVFTVAAHWVRTLTADSSGSVRWDRTNDDGRLVASGIYLFTAYDTNGNKTKGKLVIIR